MFVRMRRSNIFVMSLLFAAFIVGGLVAITVGGEQRAAPTTSPLGATSSTTSLEIVVSSDPAVTSETSGSLSTVASAPSTVAPTVDRGTLSAPPDVDAASFVVFDATNNVRMASKNPTEQRPVGSLMKLLTAYVVIDAGDPEQVVTVPPLQIDPKESQIGLFAGEELTRAVLTRAMIIVSANDAARTLAQNVGGSEAAFVDMMNDAAAELGLGGTQARNPVGLDEAGAVSTADDMLLLSRVLMANETFRATAARTSANLHGQQYPARNDLLTTYEGATGIKTGTTTQAGACLAASATRDGRTIYVVLLGASTDEARYESATALLDWAFAQPIS